MKLDIKEVTLLGDYDWCPACNTLHPFTPDDCKECFVPKSLALSLNLNKGE